MSATTVTACQAVNAGAARAIVAASQWRHVSDTAAYTRHSNFSTQSMVGLDDAGNADRCQSRHKSAVSGWQRRCRRGTPQPQPGKDAAMPSEESQSGGQRWRPAAHVCSYRRVPG